MPRLQVVIAEATALVESAQSYLYTAARELWDATMAGVENTTWLRARVRLAASHAVRASVQAVDLVHAALATSAIAVTCNRTRLGEVRICMNKDLQFRSCEEIDRRACRRDQVTMPPLRGG